MHREEGEWVEVGKRGREGEKCPSPNRLRKSCIPHNFGDNGHVLGHSSCPFMSPVCICHCSHNPHTTDRIIHCRCCCCIAIGAADAYSLDIINAFARWHLWSVAHQQQPRCLGGALQWFGVGLVIERSLVRLPAGALSSQLGHLSLPSLRGR